jgi:serine/threonine protein kinase
MNEVIPLQNRAGRPVVLKRLDEDCLLDGQLHPSIRQRLERVRELPLRGVANLLGVERHADGEGVAQLVWEYVPGRPLEEVAGDEATWRRICREVILAVEALHSTGIVHGAIHARNIIVSGAGEIRLTHVSPLLYSDPDQDEGDVIRMLRDLVKKALPETQLARDLDEADSAAWRLSDLYAQLSESSSAQADAIDEAHHEPSIRARAVFLAGISALVGMGIVFGILWYLGWRWSA